MSDDDWLEGGTAGLPAVIELPAELTKRIALAAECLARLKPRQQQFLQALRAHGFNVSATSRVIGTHRSCHIDWMHESDYATVMKVWRSIAAGEAVDRDRLLARQDDIVETLLTPQPVLYQGVPTGVETIDAGAAGRANEVLMKAAGLFPKEGAEVNVAVAFTPPQVEIEATPDSAVDAEFTAVEASPQLPLDEDWLTT